MGTHLIPRSNVKGQDRFFIIFSVPGLIGTVIGLLIGTPIYSIFKLMNNGELSLPGLVVLFLFGAAGFVVGQVQIPENGSLPLFKKVGGLYIRDVIKQYFTFSRNKKKFALEVSEDQKFDESKAKIASEFLLNKQKKE
ncbi:MAG: hypothetical protein IKR04_01075 [Clostridia bacterium]|nr:hypothetical protein [Clostridia bacterium]